MTWHATFDALRNCCAQPVSIAALLVLGTAGFAAEQHLVLESVAQLPNRIWAPSECPLYATPLIEIKSTT
jgi:hypothetical protein